MARRSVPSFSRLWQQHEALYVGLFYAALQRLSEDTFDTSDEDIISEHLCPILNNVCFEESQNGNCEIRTPDWEKPIQPVADNELKGGKIRKRPDFTCKLTNPFAAQAEDHEIPLHVECKRLGISSSPSWNLNENYVTNGIKRFDCASHEYGKRAFSGIMIGFMISLAPDTILDAVNEYQRQHCPRNPKIKFKFDKENVQTSLQKIRRTIVRPEVFKLFHLWVDLREC